MRVHIENDIYIHGTLGYTIEKKVMRNFKDKETEVVTEKEVFEVVPGGNFGTLAGAIKGLLHHKAVSISDDTKLELSELHKIIKDHKEFIESKIEF